MEVDVGTTPCFAALTALCERHVTCTSTFSSVEAFISLWALSVTRDLKSDSSTAPRVKAQTSLMIGNARRM